MELSQGEGAQRDNAEVRLRSTAQRIPMENAEIAKKGAFLLFFE
jgi:hypothetical protein